MGRIGPRSLLRIPVLGAALLTLAAALVTRLQWTAWPFELISNFPVQLTVVAGLILLAALLLRAWITVGVVGLALLLTGSTVAGTLTSDARAARVAGVRLTIGHLNAQTRAVDTAALGAYIERTRPDVFVVLDPLQADVPALTRAAPGYEVRRTGSHAGVPNYVRTVVLSRIPLTGVDHPVDPDLGPSAVNFRTADTALGVDVLVIGTESPTTPARAQRRDRVLDAAARWSRQHRPKRVVMGDFNSTPWSPSFEQLRRDGRLFDSLDGFGIQASWPESNVLLRIPIDHALLGPALAATDRGTGPSFGSQHRLLHLTVARAR